MVKVPLQNNKNWASSKCLVRKSENMCLSQNLGLWNFKNDTFCAVMYLSFTYTGFPKVVPNMGAPQNLIRVGAPAPPPHYGKP